MRSTIHAPRASERGQVLVIAALGMVAMISMVGLVLDGGSTFFQRRDQQKAVDLAALAGANDYLLHANASSAQAVALEEVRSNGWDPAVFRVNVTITPFHITG